MLHRPTCNADLCRNIVAREIDAVYHSTEDNFSCNFSACNMLQVFDQTSKNCNAIWRISYKSARVTYPRPIYRATSRVSESCLQTNWQIIDKKSKKYQKLWKFKRKKRLICKKQTNLRRHFCCFCAVAEHRLSTKVIVARKVALVYHVSYESKRKWRNNVATQIGVANWPV